MDATDGTTRQIVPDHTLWRASHDVSRVDGPAEIRAGGDCLLREVTFYVDDLGAELALSDRFRAAHKAGTATVETAGRYPFGGEIGVTQTLRYAANHVRGVTDLHWPPGTALKRHLGVAGVFLPGRWERFYCLPPCLHLAEGRAGGWQDIPAVAPGSGMIGHWHRPPLALVFERGDGTRVEVGTGGDPWRWERNLGFGPEAASYKIMAEAEGLRVVREPLMTCAEVEPARRAYRFTWYLAWSPAGIPAPQPGLPDPTPIGFSARGEALVREAASGAATPSLRLDMNAWPGPAHARRAPSAAAFLTGTRNAALCWESAAAQKAFRRVLRQIAALGPEGYLTLCGLEPGACWDPAHCERHGDPQPHWDMDALLGLSTWGRHLLGPGWQIAVEAPAWEALPSVAGLFAPTGFSSLADEDADA